MFILPSSSQLPPKTKKEAPKADLRRPKRAFDALVWAYRDEQVRCATNVDWQSGFASSGFAMMARGETGIGGGTINGLLDAHEDAVTIDAKLIAWCGADHRLYDRIAALAERAKAPPRREDLPGIRALPVFRDNGKLEMVYPLAGRNEPIACVLAYEGHGEAELERAAAIRHMFEGFLAIMPGFTLTRWRIEG